MKQSYNKINILVIGDSCIDIFKYGEASRLAPEAPAPIFNPLRIVENGGMAANVKANVEAIGANCTLITNLQTIKKTRCIDERTNTLLLRIDENDSVKRIDQKIVQNIKDNHYLDIKFDAIIISDYCKGFLTEEDIFKISSNNKNVFLDTKKIINKYASETSFIKINHKEYDRTKHTLEQLNIYPKMIITRSADGCEHNHRIYPIKKVNIKDVSGAGDTFLSGLVCEFCLSGNIEKSIYFALECATKVVQKKGVCTI